MTGNAPPTHKGEKLPPEPLTAAEVLPCCNYREDIDAPCIGTMTLAWPEYVCDTCRGRCGAQVHRQCVDEWNPGAP